MAELFDLHRGDFHAIDRLDPGPYPTVSRIGDDNGFVGFFDRPDNATVWPPKTITVSSVTGDAFVQPSPFIATDNVVLCTPKPEHGELSSACLFFLTFCMNQVKWRYSYGRQCYKTKLATSPIALPVTRDGEVDWAYADGVVRGARYWPLVEAVMG